MDVIIKEKRIKGYQVFHSNSNLPTTQLSTKKVRAT